MSGARKSKKYLRGNMQGKTLRGLLVALTLITLVSVGFLQRQNIRDWLLIRNYVTPAAIISLADQDGLTDQARKVFYVNHPMINDRATFNQHCPNNGGEQTIVLGCYHGNQAGIYLFHVTDDRLQGVMQVTAAHEMLHAAYERLSTGKRAEVDAQLKSYYATLTDPRLQTVIDAYKKSEPNDVVNEMHSIFGTEVGSLPPALETYYRQYFKDRQKIATFANQYQSEFTGRRAQVDAYDAELKALKATIDTGKQSLEQMGAALNEQRATLDGYSQSGDVASFNRGVAAYNQRVASYNNALGLLRDNIAQYNTIVGQRNTIAFEEQQLTQALDSKFTPQAAE